MDISKNCLPLLIAMDVGGTKSQAVLFRPDGEIIEIVHGAGVNPLIAGHDAAVRAYKEVLDHLISLSECRIASIYIGIPALQYFGTVISDELQEHYNPINIRSEPDGVMMISAALGHKDGACMVCGTGSGLYVRREHQIHKYGGWGWLIGGCGSGYILGLKAIQACAAERDGTGSETKLYELCSKYFNDDILNHLPELYAGGRPLFASFAGTVFEAAKQDDEVAIEIMESCSCDLARLICSAFKETGPMKVVLNGGIFQNYPDYVSMLIKKCPDEVKFISSEALPLAGAAVEAMYDTGYDADLKFIADFSSNCRERLRRKYGL